MLPINRGGDQFCDRFRRKRWFTMELSPTFIAEDNLIKGNMLSGGEILTSDVPSRSNPTISMDTVLKGKPTRLDPSGKTTNQKIREDVIPMNSESSGSSSDIDNLLTTSPINEGEDGHWDRAEELVNTKEREEVDLISASTRGFVVSFGSLIGFLTLSQSCC
ncbi:hypothetical protein ACS0TY_015028 [Phlomoides rotata]